MLIVKALLLKVLTAIIGSATKEQVNVPIKITSQYWKAPSGKSPRIKLGSVTANSVSGYTFKGWVMIATDGWVASVYPETPLNKTTNLWLAAGESTNTTSYCVCIAVYVKDTLL